MKKISRSLAAILLLAGFASCNNEPAPTPGGNPSGGGSQVVLPETVQYTEADENGDIIPDFSRVGYKWSDKAIPSYAVVKTVEAPADGSDATQLIQEAINSMTGEGAILLKKGTYNISGQLHLNKSNVVLRGEGDETILVAKGTNTRALLIFGMNNTRTLTGSAAKVVGDYIPVGTYCLELSGTNSFKAGDKVAISWIPTEKWISALKMDQIPPRGDDIEVTQWTASGYKLYWERTVRASNGKYVYLENPVVMPLESQYGTIQLQAYNYANMITESGVENLVMKSDYANDEDENHSWTAIEVYAAEHCWISDVTSHYFAFGLADLKAGAKNITIQSCVCKDPKALTDGSRKYGFYFTGGQQCLVKDCKSYGSRHGFSSASKDCGPNVFLRCEEIDGNGGDCGPHMRWASGILYDNVRTNQLLRVHDRSYMGSGHGWAGTTHVFWNCTANQLVCQSPWVSGKNYCIGCVGPKDEGNFKGRPDGEWISHNTPVAPQSLFEQQLENRRKVGYTTLPADLM